MKDIAITVDAVRLAPAKRFQQDLQIAAGGQGFALAQRRALIMLTEPMYFEDAAAQECSNKVEVFLATKDQLDQIIQPFHLQSGIHKSARFCGSIQGGWSEFFVLLVFRPI